MQDEVTKHTRKIYATVKNRKHTFGEKVKEIIIEICIIVFAVTLSIWLHSWSESRHEQKEAREFLKGLKDDLTKDISLLEENKRVVNRLDSNYTFLLSLNNNPAMDTIKAPAIAHRLYFDLRSTHANIGRYEGFKSSGKMGTIENDSLKEHILVFYQQTLPDLIYGENYVNALQSKILDLQIDKDKQSLRDFVTSVKIQSLLSLGTQNFKVNAGIYDKTIQQAREIIAEIDKEMNE